MNKNKREKSKGSTTGDKSPKIRKYRPTSDTSSVQESGKNECKDTETLKFSVLNTTEPLVIKSMLNWKILEWNLKKWNEVLQNEDLDFRCGKNAYTKVPQWETETKIIKGKFSDIEKYSLSGSEWIYFDYKYLKHNFLHLKELRDSICWDMLGLNTVSVDDCALWIGSKGAHTSLHVDTYGCNVVAQVYGRKLWVLFPPDTDLNETRVPYEESSIFSKYNMFCPDILALKNVKNCRKVILNPGEILVLPCRWWHYVENLEPAISINAWIPLPQDDNQRLKESIVQMLMIRMTSGLPEVDRKHLINPMSFQNMTEDSPLGEFQIIDRCKDICLKNNIFDDELPLNPNMNVEEIIKKHKNIEVVPALSRKEYIKFLEKQANRFLKIDEVQPQEDLHKVIDVINAITHSDVISLIQDKLLQK